MATTLETPPDTTRRQPLLLCLVVALAVVVACIAVDRVVAFHLAPRLAGHWPNSLLTELQLLVVVAPYAVFALALALWGISARHRLAGAACALLAGLIAWGIPYAYQKVFYEHDHITQSNLRFFDWLMTLSLPTVIALAWGLARRTGVVWVLGVPAATALAWADRRLELNSSRWRSWEFQQHSWWEHRLEFLAPAIVAAAVCWALERPSED